MIYSERMQAIIRFSGQEAARLNHDHISTGHLLLALIREGRGTAIAFLENNGINLESMKLELEKMMDNRSRGSIIGKMQFTSRANSALEMASEESRKLGQECTGTEHLLIGLIREREGVAAKVLEKYGINIEDSRAAARAVLSESKEMMETSTFKDVDVNLSSEETDNIKNEKVSTELSPNYEVLNIEEASQLLRISEDDMSKLLEDDDIPGRNINGEWRFSKKALIKWLGEGSSKNYTEN
ncbi:helix-turn-helix domain-containing protein [Candidatus Poribacteria bacterium]|nr:helix-turn-helix domain-containing protein [Candidatus Poribacteria bacterium]